jgi:hypothetical protein
MVKPNEAGLLAVARVSIATNWRSVSSQHIRRKRLRRTDACGFGEFAVGVWDCSLLPGGLGGVDGGLTRATTRTPAISMRGRMPAEYDQSPEMCSRFMRPSESSSGAPMLANRSCLMHRSSSVIPASRGTNFKRHIDTYRSTLRRMACYLVLQNMNHGCVYSFVYS